MKRVILLLVLILLISSGFSFAEVPGKINYQGRLIKDGVPVDGTRTMRFSIYNSAVGGTQLWSSGDTNVTVYNGLFRYVLDLSTIDWAAGETLYLEVKVESDILTPREEIYAYPYAINSHLLEGATKEYFLNTSGETQKKDGGLNIMGNVGIGTTDPEGGLDIKGNWLQVTGPTDRNLGKIILGMGPSVPEGKGSGTITFWDGTATDLSLVYPSEDVGYMQYKDDDFLIMPYNNVGIGTSSPNYKLDVKGSINASSLNVSDNVALAVNSGKVGIGTTQPNEKLSVEGTISLQEQSTSPLVDAGYGKIYAKPEEEYYEMEFDGQDDYVDVGNDASLDITGSITLSAWVNPSAISGNSIITKRTWSGGPVVQYLLAFSDNNLRFLWYNGGWRGISYDASSMLNQWSHVVGTYDADSDLVKLYVNGDEVASGTETSGFISNAYSVWIGAWISGTPQNVFNGKIDEVAIWSRALDLTEIDTIHDEGRDTDLAVGHGTNLVAYWPVEQADGSSVNDQVGSSDGTYNGGVGLSSSFAPGLYYMSSDGTKTALGGEGGGGTSPDSDWVIDIGDMYSGVSGNVGIGTTDPGVKLDVDGTVRAKKYEFPGGGNAGQFPQYWRVNDAIALTTSWQTVGQNNGITSTLSALFPGYVDMEVLFFYVASFDTNPTTIDTRMYYYDGAWNTYTLSSATSFSVNRNYRYAGSVLLSDYPGISWVSFQAKLSTGTSNLYDVFVVFRPIY